MSLSATTTRFAGPSVCALYGGKVRRPLLVLRQFGRSGEGGFQHAAHPCGDHPRAALRLELRKDARGIGHLHRVDREQAGSRRAGEQRRELDVGAGLLREEAGRGDRHLLQIGGRRIVVRDAVADVEPGDDSPPPARGRTGWRAPARRRRDRRPPCPDRTRSPRRRTAFSATRQCPAAASRPAPAVAASASLYGSTITISRPPRMTNWSIA